MSQNKRVKFFKIITICYKNVISKNVQCKNSSDIESPFNNLKTDSNKISYLDKFLDRGANAFDFTNGISEALHDKNSKHSWFLQ
jgi:hypothetical protein